jgi:flagellar motor switch protein FliN/FliY
MFTPSSTVAAPAVAADSFGLFATGFFEATGPALTTVLNRRATAEVVAVETLTLDALCKTRPLPWVLVEIPFARGLSGTQWLVLGLADAVRFGEVLLGGQDEAAELNDGHLGAIRDAVNQMLASAGPALMPLFARSIAYGPATVRSADATLPAELGAGPDRLSVITARVRANGDLQLDMLLLTDEGLSRDIASAGAVTPAAASAPAPDDRSSSRLDLILDVTLPVTVELGRARMQIQDVLKLAPGSVIELDKSAGDPVELFINDRAIAKGEVVIIDENFGIRLTSIVTATERIKTLR